MLKKIYKDLCLLLADLLINYGLIFYCCKSDGKVTTIHSSNLVFNKIPALHEVIRILFRYYYNTSLNTSKNKTIHNISDFAQSMYKSKIGITINFYECKFFLILPFFNYIRIEEGIKFVAISLTYKILRAPPIKQIPFFILRFLELAKLTQGLSLG